MLPLEAISPADGRYRKLTETLSAYFSEAALIRYRIIVEGEYLIALSEEKGLGLRKFTRAEKNLIRELSDVTLENAKEIKEFEAVTNHDVKAVEYYLKERLKQTSLRKEIEWVHFALTSEDTNNLAYGLALDRALEKILVPALALIRAVLERYAVAYADLAMLARTHGQSASPTTLGKEFKVFECRLARQLASIKKFRISAKLNGATGNYNAHVAAYPSHDWRKFTLTFISKLNQARQANLEPNLVTTQIEPHDSYAELFDLIRRVNTILVDLNQDIWRYISDGWIVQKAAKGETGSSTMPHKVNPIDFENSEGNLGVANALLGYFSAKLPVSRLQRDLSDSTVERNFGTAFAHCLIAYSSLLKGLGKISPHPEKIAADLEDHPEVIAEAVQTILRREGVSQAYEGLKALTRGRKATKKDFENFIKKLNVSEKIKRELRKITPRNYVGLAEELAKEEDGAIKSIKNSPRR
ncbi:MAG: adenylosuccinate lyase [Candidatus Parcubacteria bacterium]|jgi:adenylosuccinate lyase|nr:adenylosuccinate lyase [Candidatus Parcubacteria bacterium]